MNWFLFTLMAVLIIAGLWFIKCAADYAENADLLRKQQNWLMIGSVIYLTLAVTDYEWWLKLAPLFFIGAVAVLAGVLMFGMTLEGATRWLKIGGYVVQPAEPSKIAFILGMSWLVLVLGEYKRKLWFFLLTGGVALIPAALILKQPDLGTALVFFPMTLAIMWAAGVPKRYLALLLVAVAAGYGFARFVVYQAWWDGTVSDLLPAGQRTVHILVNQTDRLPPEQQAKLIPPGAGKKQASLSADGAAQKKKGVLIKPYQLDRIKTFFNPDLDPLGAGWNIRQSLNTIGSGGFKGTGVVSEYGALPKKIAYNDFIFAVIGEITGFVGGSLFIISQAALIIGVLYVAARAKDLSGTLLCLGFAALLFAHFFVNIGMTIKVVPITGIPLPFTSHGGSFLLTCLAGMGLVQSVWIHRKNFYNH
ncbi:MAG: rod shape-determining protein RodA [Verrucomicrobiales bacterium]|nr:rod shape-determining protein RodA [Verrucomicrobiales bacterium]